MNWITRSLPPEADDPPPAPPSRRDVLLGERAQLLLEVRPRIRSCRQERIRRRIADLTREILRLENPTCNATISQIASGP